MNISLIAAITSKMYHAQFLSNVIHDSLIKTERALFPIQYMTEVITVTFFTRGAAQTVERKSFSPKH